MMSNNAVTNGHTVRKLNFGAGPAQLPLEVLENVQAEFLDYNKSGSNVMELSHRSSAFGKIIQDAEHDIREILSIPESYAVLFLQGGATAQFSGIPLSFLNLKPSQTADYLVTGYWSEKAAKEAEKFGKVNWVVPKVSKYQGIPAENTWKLTEDPSYFYYCANETIHGIEIEDIPSIVPKDVPIVCDMSSNFLTRPLDISKFAVIFASAQKNFGTSGLVLVILRKDLVEKVTNKSIPVIFDYKVQIENGSMYNTPPTFSIYIANKMFDWIKRQGGLKAIDHQSAQKSSIVYETIDQSNGFYVNSIELKFRSRVNIPLRIVSNGTPNEKLESLFLSEAIKSNMIELKGHRAVGGIRVSLYNGVSLEETNQLVNFMRVFQTNNS
jgi:phosphoserine aminotransferase